MEYEDLGKRDIMPSRGYDGNPHIAAVNWFILLPSLPLDTSNCWRSIDADRSEYIRHMLERYKLDKRWCFCPSQKPGKAVSYKCMIRANETGFHAQEMNKHWEHYSKWMVNHQHFWFH